VRYDGVMLDGGRLRVPLLSGRHVIEMAMRRQTLGNRYLYSNVTGSAVFVAEAGHKYLVDVELVSTDKWLGLVASTYDWIGRVIDETTGDIVAITNEPLPVKIEASNIFHDFAILPD
jgi:hypothetical protein